MKRICFLLVALCLVGCDEDSNEFIVQEGNDHDSQGISEDTDDIVVDDDTEEPEVSDDILGGNDDVDENDEPEIPEVKDSCDNACKNDEQCIDGLCLPICAIPAVLCGTKCIVLEDLHLESCTSCAAGYCDSDDDLTNGCDIVLEDDDALNCGSCGNVCALEQICKDGKCSDRCEENQILCGEQCINPEELHLKSCDECADYFCDDDDNLLNGCEIDALSGNMKHCGACGNACEAGDKCSDGLCAHRYYAMANPTQVVTGSGSSLGKLKQYTIVNVVEKKSDKYRIMHADFEGKDAWIDAAKLMDAGDQYEGRKAIDFAEIYLYDADKKLCTYDYKTHEPLLPYLATVYGDYNNHCADFVTAVLQNVGMISKHENGANSLARYCAAGNDGYRTLTNLSEAKAGDVWVNNGHAELVVGYYKEAKKLLLIGSNNASSGIYSISHNTYGCNGGQDPGKKNACENGERDCSRNQRVTYSPLHNDGKAYSRQ